MLSFLQWCSFLIWTKWTSWDPPVSLSQLRACYPCHMRTHNHSVPHRWAAYASSDLHSSGDPLLQCCIRVMLFCSKVLKGTSSQQPHIWLTNYPWMPLSFIFWLSVCKFKPFHYITILINTCSTSEILSLAMFIFWSHHTIILPFLLEMQEYHPQSLLHSSL